MRQSKTTTADRRANAAAAHAEFHRITARIRRWNSPRPVPLSALRPGAVVWADTPFRDVNSSKGRPAVIVAATGSNVTVLPVTTSMRRLRSPADYHEVTNLATAGLSRPSGVHKRHVVLDRSAVSGVLGSLATTDYEQVFGVPYESVAA
jgi:hypothetical protein